MEVMKNRKRIMSELRMVKTEDRDEDDEDDDPDRLIDD